MSICSKNNQIQPIVPVLLQWDEKGRPLSKDYGDVYFSKTSGIQESQFVFLQHNSIEQRFKKLNPQDLFTIAETGFGTGLNFLCTMKAWQQRSHQQATLDYISFEKHPLKKTDMKMALALWPELNDYVDTLLHRYPETVAGWHRIHFAEMNINLTLVFGDINTELKQLNYRQQTFIDAWYLDGFAPSKNPDMWTDCLFSHMQQLTKTNGSFATYTAAGIVKRGLSDHGFNIKKTKGFGPKRDMLHGQLTSSLDSSKIKASTSQLTQPWYIQPTHTQDLPQQAVIIGGGLAGTSTALHLANKGYQVTLLERHAQLAPQASGNPQGVLYGQFTGFDSSRGHFSIASYLYTLRYLTPFLESNAELGRSCGVLQLANTENKLNKQLALIKNTRLPSSIIHPVTAEKASQIANTHISHAGLFFPQASWLQPKELCNIQSLHNNITIRYNTTVSQLSYEKEHKTWQLLDDQQQLIIESPVVIIANSNDAKKFQQSRHLPIKKVRGQLSYLDSTTIAPDLHCVVCDDGYVCPQLNKQFCIGATFNETNDNPNLCNEDHKSNISMLNAMLPELSKQLSTTATDGRVAFRCTTPDYLPIVGPVPDHQQFINDYPRLRTDAKWRYRKPGSYLPGLYLNIGHGSHGLSSTPLAAETLACLISGHVSPVPASLLNALNPARFIIQGLSRNQL